MTDIDMEHMKGQKGDSGVIGIKQYVGLWLNERIQYVSQNGLLTWNY